MQSSLLALLLASKFFSEPLVRLPCGISVIVMTLVRACHPFSLWQCLQPVPMGPYVDAVWVTMDAVCTAM